jgi:hypothetical protein
LSLLLHGLLFAIYWEPPLSPAENAVLEVVLEPVELPEDVSDPEREEAPLLEPVLTVAEPEPEPESEPAQITDPVVIEETILESTDTPIPRTTLNLSHPENWDTLIDTLPDPDVTLYFNEDLKERVAIREQDKRRKALVDARVAAVYGVSDEEYTREGPRGKEIKIDGRCYILVDSPGIESGTRWWRSPCGDTHLNPFLLEPIEYDAIGRVVAD